MRLAYQQIGEKCVQEMSQRRNPLGKMLIMNIKNPECPYFNKYLVTGNNAKDLYNPLYRFSILYRQDDRRYFKPQGQSRNCHRVGP